MSIKTPCYFGNPKEENSIQVSIEVTNVCNLNCVHCMNKSSSNSEIVGMDFEKIDNLIDELCEYNISSFYLTGGEPTLYAHFEFLVNKIKSKGIPVLLATNAYDIERKIDFIKEKIDCVFVSIDGIKNTHNLFRGKNDAYDKTLKNIKLLIDNNIPVRISTVISKHNINEIDLIISNVLNLGVFRIHFTVLVDVGRADEDSKRVTDLEYKELMKSVKRTAEKYKKIGFEISTRRDGALGEKTCKCFGGTNIIHINAEGKVFPCSYIAKSPIAEQFSEQWYPGNLSHCMNKIKMLDDINNIRYGVYRYNSCLAMACINNKNSNFLTEDPLNRIFNDE